MDTIQRNVPDWENFIPKVGNQNAQTIERRDWLFPAPPFAGEQVFGWREEKRDRKAEQMYELYSMQDTDFDRETRRIELVLLGWLLRTLVLNNIKRAFDLLIAFCVLPIVLPVMLITALVIKIDSPGPVFFKQKWVGKWGRTFTCYKFRSMCADAEAQKASLMDKNEADCVVFKIKRDPRITRVGCIIRKLSIDELPQIFNVIKGDMSIVGPRPPVPCEVEKYSFDIYRRLDSVPGITGLQQVSGRSALTFKRWVEFDLEYIRNQSLIYDIKILLRTVPAVLSGKGAY